MAYMNQEKKAAISPAINAILKKYNIKGSLSVRHHSTLVLTLKSGSIDFVANHNKMIEERAQRRGEQAHLAKDYIQVNTYWLKENFSGKALKFMEEAYKAMMAGNHNNSDIMTDYFDVGWYADINVGKWNKGYEVK